MKVSRGGPPRCKTLDVALQPETRAALAAYLEWGRPALIAHSPADPGSADDPGWVFLSHRAGEPRPLTMNALSLMLTRRYHAGGGSLRTFGSHRIRHATATLLVNNGMPLEDVKRCVVCPMEVLLPTRRSYRG